MNNLYTSGIINNQMSIGTKLKLFKVYSSRLFSRMDVNCSNLIQTNWVGELKKCEGNAIKQIIGIAKRCHTSPIYGAMNMESTVS